MTERRTKIDIINDILASIYAKGKLKKTHVMYKANLSHKLLNLYLGELMGKGMVQEIVVKDIMYITITEKGVEFLNQFRKMKEFKDLFGL